MLKYGPVDVVVLAAGEPRFDGSVLAELEKQAALGTIRVLDAMILMKDEAGRQWRLDLKDLPPEQAAAVGFIEDETQGMLNEEDAEIFFEGMVPGSAVVALAIEHTWAVNLVNAIAGAGFEVALNFRVPAPIVSDAYASLAETTTRNAVDRRQANKNAAAYSQAMQQAAPPPQEAYAPPPQPEYAPPAPSEDDVISQLERLGALHAQGILTDQEFAEQKAKLLAG
jgi:hypothetical protein